MKFASLEIVRKLKPRLGFGPAEGDEPPEKAVPTDVPPPVMEDAGLPIRIENEDVEDESQVAMARLLEELEAALKDSPVEAREKASEGIKDLAGSAAAAPQVEPEAEAPAAAICADPLPEGGGSIVSRVSRDQGVPKVRKTLEGCKVGAVGFGRQDIASLATTMIEQRARLEFLPRGSMEMLNEFDLLLLNGASVESLKREAANFRSVLESGIPTIVIGSRTTLNMLRETGDARTWDFIAKPLHMEELVWRAVNLLSRFEDAGIGRPLPSRVVVADHDPFTRSLVESTMTQMGVECEMAEEGDAAWSAIEKSAPGAVILDLTLPNRDGFQLMADIRRSAGRKPKIIVLSARQSEADILRAFALGADEYITKPFSPLELSARLMRLLGNTRESA